MDREIIMTALLTPPRPTSRPSPTPRRGLLLATAAAALTALLALALAVTLVLATDGLSSDRSEPAGSQDYDPMTDYVETLSTWHRNAGWAPAPYDPMQDYVDTLVYWHHNPAWSPAG
jgi:hypothetical protein